MTDPWTEWLAKILHETHRECLAPAVILPPWDALDEQEKGPARKCARMLFAHPELEIRSKAAAQPPK